MVNPGAAAPGDDHISPWEMFDVGLDAEAVLAETPALPQELRTRLLAAVRRIMREPRFEIFAHSPGINVFHSGRSTGVPPPLTSTHTFTHS